MYNIDIWQVVAWIFLLSATAKTIRAEWGDPPMRKVTLKRIWAFRWTALVLIAGGIYFGRQLLETTGFNPNWPDAIVCTVQEPADVNKTRVPTTFIFRGVGLRGSYGEVAMYYFPGWQNTTLPPILDYPKTGYVTHEIWFKADGSMISRPQIDPAKEFEDKGQVVPPQLMFEALYWRSNVGDPSCGGRTMKEIIGKGGRAFSFARPFK